jgi:tetratricopeptide (TPR) repeat protein
MNQSRRSLAFFALVVVSGCQASGTRSGERESRAQLFAGLGNHHREITTSSKRAQRYFDQGLTWAYAFNHDEAIRSFTECARLDPDCAMCWWGVALCNGPHINNPAMTAVRSKAAWEALQKAISLRNSASEIERAMIDALAKRYADPSPADRKPLDTAYADAMREVWLAHGTEADIGVLFAEAAMDLRPWDLWTKDGKPQPGTDEINAVLNAVLALDPYHPGAVHLYIHSNEASPTPGKALVAADRLRRLVPASGHLVHMPSHIDVLTGQWAQASKQNVLAIEADRKYRALSPQQDFYRVYMAHNHHMLAFASMMEGRGDACIRATREMVAGIPEDYARLQPALVDPVAAAPYEALMRFGRWDEILAEPVPPDYLPITTALWRFCRGVAFAAKGQVAEANAERSAFREAAAQVPASAMMSINPAKNILAIAEHMLNGEIAYRQGRIDEAVTELNKAIVVEDQLQYMEPPEWIQPVRHTLGAILFDAGRYEDAEKVYRADLAKWPDNGWSLYGLAQCLRAKGELTEADQVERRFNKIWSRADTKIGSSCLCVAGRS